MCTAARLHLTNSVNFLKPLGRTCFINVRINSKLAPEVVPGIDPVYDGSELVAVVAEVTVGELHSLFRVAHVSSCELQSFMYFEVIDGKNSIIGQTQ